MAFGGNFYAIVDLEPLRPAVRPRARRTRILAGRPGHDGRDQRRRTGRCTPRTPRSPAATTCSSLAPGLRRAQHSRHAMAIHPGLVRPVAVRHRARARGWPSCTRAASCRSARTSSTSRSSARRFVGRLVEETTVGGRPAVVPTITGRAWVTGTAQYMLDPATRSRRASSCDRRGALPSLRGRAQPARGDHGDPAGRGHGGRARARDRLLRAQPRRAVRRVGDARPRGDARPVQGGPRRDRPQQGLPGEPAHRGRARRDHRDPGPARGPGRPAAGRGGRGARRPGASAADGGRDRGRRAAPRLHHPRVGGPRVPPRAPRRWAATHASSRSCASLRTSSRLYGLRAASDEEALFASWHEHAELLDRIDARDADGAEALMRRHIGHVRGIWAEARGAGPGVAAGS